ncbi:MAG: methyltransferase domain-containing protein [Gemmatimonadetes bacterium]|nr:methyltransferase domain-containing protein [Gemmatimonadota bacterium]
MSERRATGRTERSKAGTAGTPSFETYGGSAPENYERYFVPAIGAPLAAPLVDLASLQSSDRVLDVACGTGVVARLAAERVGPTGSVSGLDVNPGMLAAARAATPRDIEIDWHESSADAIPLPDGAYDVVLCQMGLQFFPDKRAALREMRRVLAPGGRLALNVPGPTPRVLTILAEGLARHLSPELANFVNVVFSLHEPRELEELLEDAGFGDVSIDSSTRTLRLPAPAEFLWQYVCSTPLAAAVAKVDDERRAALQRDVVSEWDAFTEDGRLTLQVGVAQATAWNR